MHFYEVKEKEFFELTPDFYNNENDKYKMKCANENEFSVIRLLQEDVFSDKYDWLEILKDNIEKNKNTVQNVFMCNDNEYEIFVNI